MSAKATRFAPYCVERERRKSVLPLGWTWSSQDIPQLCDEAERTPEAADEFLEPLPTAEVGRRRV